jgi:hypothetical protein
MEAVKMAGFGSSVTLIEEPLAAFYYWLINHETDWQEHVKPDDLILEAQISASCSMP